MKKMQSKMKELEYSQHFSHYKSMGNLSDAQGQLSSQSLVETDRNSNYSEILYVLITCKNEGDPIKNKGARVLTRLYIDFQMLKGR